MSGGGKFIFSDPDCYAAGFGDLRLNLTITGAGEFKAALTLLRLQHMEIYGCCESLSRIAYLSLPSETVLLSFVLGNTPSVFDGFGVRYGDIMLHSRGEQVHQWSKGEYQWALISLSAEWLASCSKALTENTIVSPPASRILRPSRTEAARLQGLFKKACHLAETRGELIEHVEIARALEQDILHALVHCLTTGEDADDNSRTRHHRAAVMVRFEEVLNQHVDQKLSMPELCAKVGVPERTLRMCCAEFVGVSPTRYILLQRLNKARSALRRADPSTTSVAEVARNHQFLELGRFAVTYRATFGESPSITLQRGAPN